MPRARNGAVEIAHAGRSADPGGEAVLLINEAGLADDPLARKGVLLRSW